MDKHISDFINSFESILGKYIIDDSNNEIYRKTGYEFIKDESINKQLPENIISLIIKKLNIESKIEEIELGEFKSGVDKILGDDYIGIGRKLTITVNGNIFYEYTGCIDDYKFIDDVEQATKILDKDVKDKQFVYTKILINSYYNIFGKKIEEQNSKTQYYELNTLGLPFNQPIAAYGGSKKNSKKN